MKRLVEFPSDTGEAVVVEIEDLQPRGGPRRDLATSVVVERAHNSFEDALEKARALASGLISRLQKRIADSPGELPDQVQIEFGGFAGSSFRAYYFCNVV